MPGIGIGGLREPPARYRIEGLAKFESDASSRKEDGTRGGRLAVQAASGSRHHRRELRNLSQKLLAASRGEPVLTLASHVTWRQARRRILPHIWKACHESGFPDWTTTTLIPRGWDLTPDELRAVDPRRLLEGLRADLKRCGASSANGYIALFIHGDWHASEQRFQLHVHGVVGGGMIGVVKRLRQRPKYQASGASGRVRVRRRVHLSKRPLANMPYPLTYIMKSGWHWSSRRDHDGKMVRRKHRTRMPEPMHSIALLWLDRWRLEDISLLIGMRPSKSGFLLSKLKASVHE